MTDNRPGENSDTSHQLSARDLHNRLAAEYEVQPSAGAEKLASDDRTETSRVGNTKSAGLLSLFWGSLKLPKPIIIASVVSSLLGLALPLAVLQIYDRILPNKSVETLWLLTLGLFAIFALDAFLKIARSNLLGWYAVRNGFKAQLTAVDQLLNAPHDEIEKKPAAIWVDSLDAVSELSAFEGGQSRLLVLDIPLAGIFLLVLALVGGPLAIVPVMLIVWFGIKAALQGNALRKVLTKRKEQDIRKQNLLIECLSGIQTVKGLAMEPMIQRRFERLQKGSAVTSYDTILMANQLQSTGVLFANMMMICVVSVGALLVMSGQLSIGGLACCSLLSGRLTQPVLRGIGMWTEFQNIKLAQERADMLTTIAAGNNNVSATHADITGAIALRNVSYSHQENHTVIDNLSLNIRPGEFVGIKGDDGSGRSTLLKLITGELIPQQGEVVIGGLEDQPEIELLRTSGAAYVSATSRMFKGTIIENISMFRSGNAVEIALRAARLIGLDAEINRLPEGYDTLLTQGVSQALPSGLLQRIAIARALASNPKVLIFDEANTFLDFQSDQALRKGLESLKGRITAIIISNRPSFVGIADHIYTLKDGKLIPEGITIPERQAARSFV